MNSYNDMSDKDYLYLRDYRNTIYLIDIRFGIRENKDDCLEEAIMRYEEKERIDNAFKEADDSKNNITVTLEDLGYEKDFELKFDLAKKFEGSGVKVHPTDFMEQL